MADYRGRLELTWTNKHERLLARDDGGYTWCPRSDYRVAEVRLLRDAGTTGETHPDAVRAKGKLLATTASPANAVFGECRSLNRTF